jgi:hypothetical protein
MTFLLPTLGSIVASLLLLYVSIARIVSLRHNKVQYNRMTEKTHDNLLHVSTARAVFLREAKQRIKIQRLNHYGNDRSSPRLDLFSLVI